MKGTIEKINDNWMVILDQRTYQDPSAEDLILPLHIDDLWVIDHTSYILGKKQELNFYILTVEEEVTPCGTHIIYKDYAKLILKENHIGDTNEMVDQVPDVRKMVEWIDKEILLNPYYADSPRLREGANMVKVKLQQYTPTSSQTERMYSEEDLREALFYALNIDRTTCCTTRATDSFIIEGINDKLMLMNELQRNEVENLVEQILKRDKK